MSEEGRKPKDFGAAGPMMWKNRTFASEEGNSCKKTKDSWCNGGKSVGNFAPEKG